MKKQTLKLGGRVLVTVSELTADGIADGLDIFNEIKDSGDLEGELNIMGLVGKYRSILTFIDTMVEFTTPDTAEFASEDVITSVGQLAISELKELLDAAKEVNSAFLELLREGGLDLLDLWEKSAN